MKAGTVNREVAARWPGERSVEQRELIVGLRGPGGAGGQRGAARKSARYGVNACAKIGERCDVLSVEEMRAVPDPCSHRHQA